MMNQNQEYAFSLVEKGKNVYISGAGGSGKTFWINETMRRLRVKSPNKLVGKTSMTGSAAILIGGTTLHSYLGIGIAKDTMAMIQRVRKLRKREVWENTNLLIIDEVSMLSKEIFESLDYIGKELRRNPRPFGGMQVVLCGDFCQLGCIGSESFCFESAVWKCCIHETVLFTESFRQRDDLVFARMLDRIRFGQVTPDIEEALNSRILEYRKTSDIEPTRLYPYKRDVCDINKRCLEELILLYKKPSNVYRVRTTFSKDRLRKYVPGLEDVLHLCADAQVILTVNLDIPNGLVNGSRGVVKHFTLDGLPVVTFLNGMTLTIDYFKHTIEEKSVEVCSCSQIPLMLGWAITIHKSQGMTLDLVITDLSNVFDYGQAYVTLSRVKNLASLFITDINFQKIRCNPKVLEFYSSI